MPPSLMQGLVEISVSRSDTGTAILCISLLQGYKQKGAYMATQCPLQNTVTDFWRMVNEFQCGCIVMLCELEIDGQVCL